MLENFALIKKKINSPILSTYSMTIPKIFGVLQLLTVEYYISFDNMMKFTKKTRAVPGVHI